MQIHNIDCLLLNALIRALRHLKTRISSAWPQKPRECSYLNVRTLLFDLSKNLIFQHWHCIRELIKVRKTQFRTQNANFAGVTKFLTYTTMSKPIYNNCKYGTFTYSKVDKDIV